MATITTRLRCIGEPIFVAGFRASQRRYAREQDSIRLIGDVLVCTGVVTERFEAGRDRAMLPGPAIEVECPAWGGMSGGPAFDKNGRIVGLLSSSYTGPNDTVGPS